MSRWVLVLSNKILMIIVVSIKLNFRDERKLEDWNYENPIDRCKRTTW
jgi:hypothetical protein